jgi:hypothetical protein
MDFTAVLVCYAYCARGRRWSRLRR